jgi:hypothetical protein
MDLITVPVLIFLSVKYEVVELQNEGRCCIWLIGVDMLSSSNESPEDTRICVYIM